MTPDRRKVFVIHGRNVRVADEMAAFLRALGLEPIIFRDLRARLGGTPGIAEIVTRGMDEAHGVIALFTGDEYAVLRSELKSPRDEGEDLARWQARPNVIFEAGMAFGRDRQRVILVLLGEVRLFSDVAGIHVLRPSNDPTQDRETLRRTLQGIQCDVNDSSAWMTAGDLVGSVLAADERQNPLPIPLRSRTELLAMDAWAPADKAQDILIIGQNLNLVMRQRSFFERKLRGGARLRLVIVNPKDDALIDVMSRGVVERMYTKADFGPALTAIQHIRETLPASERSRVDLRTIDYVPTLSCQVLDGSTSMGTILVELAPNRIEVPNRAHLMLYSDNQTHAPWYAYFLKNFEGMFAGATPWDWDSA